MFYSFRKDLLLTPRQDFFLLLGFFLLPISYSGKVLILLGTIKILYHLKYHSQGRGQIEGVGFLPFPIL